MKKKLNFISKVERLGISGEYQDFSLFLFFSKIFVCINLFLIPLIIADYFLDPVKKPAEVTYIELEIARIEFSDRSNFLIELDLNNDSLLTKGRELTVAYTPIFNNRKFLVVFDESNNINIICSYTYALSLITISLNFFAFFFLFLIPQKHEKLISKADHKHANYNSSETMDAWNHIHMVYLLPIFFSLYHWYYLYNYLINSA